jgi:hypothetical protein
MTTEKVKYGVHSEAGKLRKVMVCSPGLVDPQHIVEQQFVAVVRGQSLVGQAR